MKSRFKYEPFDIKPTAKSCYSIKLREIPKTGNPDLSTRLAAVTAGILVVYSQIGG
jgi:hypothetical protein